MDQFKPKPDPKAEQAALDKLEQLKREDEARRAKEAAEALKKAPPAPVPTKPVPPVDDEARAKELRDKADQKRLAVAEAARLAAMKLARSKAEKKELNLFGDASEVEDALKALSDAVAKFGKQLAELKAKYVHDVDVVTDEERNAANTEAALRARDERERQAEQLKKSIVSRGVSRS